MRTSFSSQEHILELLDLHMGGPFRWGVSDCFVSSSSVLYDLLGVDLASDVRGRYNSEEGAQRILSEYGGSLSVFAKVQARAKGLKYTPLTQSSEPPLGALGVTPKEYSFGLDGQGSCIYFGRGLWAAKTLRGYTFSAQSEGYIWNA